MQLDDLYRRVIMDHYKSPRNRGPLNECSTTISLNNPTCGDKIQLHLILKDDAVEYAKFTGEGCSISLSSASMMTEAIKGKTFEEVYDMIQRFSRLMQGTPQEFSECEDLEALSGVSKFPARIKCATLAWNALQKAIEQQKV